MKAIYLLSLALLISLPSYTLSKCNSCNKNKKQTVTEVIIDPNNPDPNYKRPYNAYGRVDEPWNFDQIVTTRIMPITDRESLAFAMSKIPAFETNIPKEPLSDEYSMDYKKWDITKHLKKMKKKLMKKRKKKKMMKKMKKKKMMKKKKKYMNDMISSIYIPRKTYNHCLKKCIHRHRKC